MNDKSEFHEYTVHLSVEGRVDVHLRAKSFDDAAKKAYLFIDCDNIEFVNSKPIYAEDEKGNRKEF